MKKKYKTKKKLASIERRKLLSKWSLSIRERDGWLCQVCGATERLQAHHLLPKLKYKEYIYDLYNGITLCSRCHMFGRESAEGNALWWNQWLKKYKPEQYRIAINRIGDV